MYHTFKRIFAGTLLASGIMGNAHAVPIAGGETSVTLTAAEILADLGLAVTGLGTATLELDAAGTPVATFAITGGSVDDVTGDALIEHDGSGLQLNDGTDTVQLENFLIDTSTALLTGLVSVNNTEFGQDVPLFEIGAGLSLTLTAAAGGALSSVFGIADLSGAAIGSAVTSPTTNGVGVPVSEPPMVLLLGLGIVALIGWQVRQHNTSSMAAAA